ncbi:ArsR/SmtB family transcription factor [Fuchsiella alkaliacetigena]|uniref:ArsR/SmtB family transcription factor n=1 Tax=Fuchsiella alkaliacetigena TaxID=957042 RepID=UPI00200A46CA|nr:metalloregulator ArsR/SmtB family transcription factor [Fuchsiella alkaliacetigena]MCK8825817.1 metalloregulator ArsR/SmtB family transcription factor [Fuchsiella alkaliacetigena]
MPEKEKCLSCEVHELHKENIELIKDRELSEEIILKLAETFKVLGDPTRIKIIHALSNVELCVCDISELLEVSSSAVSHQLRLLRNLNLVKYRKEGRSVYYSLIDDHILKLFSQGLEHVLAEDKDVYK